MSQDKVVCFVGLCGAGMAPLAIYLSERGIVVYGRDDFPDPAVKDLLISKHVIFLPTKILPEHCDAVIISSAIRVDVDEICKAAKSSNVSIWKRGEYLSHITSDRKLIAIVGSHGKTSVCANMSEIAIKNNMHVDYVVGGFFKDDKYPPAQYFPDSEWVIAEVDESDCTMEAFSPHVTVALNYDDDHVANYHGSEGLKAAFSRFFLRTKSKIFLTSGDQVFPSLVKESRAEIEVIEKLSMSNFALRNQEIAKHVFADIFGENVDVNCDFDGAKRRNDLLCQADNITFVHDYAHHPTEVKALLEYARQKYHDYEITAIFQPHRVTRTQQYYREFAETLQKFDNIILVDIYRAFEERSSVVSSALIFDRISNPNKILIDDLKNLGSFLEKYCQELDKNRKHLVLFICAGDLVKYAKEFVNEWASSAVQRELLGVKCSENVTLRDKTTFACDSLARLLVQPKNIDELKHVIAICRKYKRPYFVLGNGSNVIFPDCLFFEVVIKLDGDFWQKKELIDNNTLRAFAYVKLPQLAKYIENLGFDCCLPFACIPATIGGAIRMNAGAHGYSMSNIVKSVTVLNDDGEIVQLKNSECGFKYRGSAVTEIVLYADLKLENVDSLSADDFIKFRKNSQPTGHSFGSIFKNPSEESAGKLIDLAGLKGARRGDAAISEKHANFMLNLGHATSKDVEALVDYVRYMVFSKFGVFLENEFLLLRK